MHMYKLYFTSETPPACPLCVVCVCIIYTRESACVFVHDTKDKDERKVKSEAVSVSLIKIQ